MKKLTFFVSLLAATLLAGCNCNEPTNPSNSPTTVTKQSSDFSIENAPVVSSFVGQKVEFSSLGSILVTYVDTTTESVAISQEMIGEIDIFSLETQDVSITYQSIVKYFEVTLAEDIASAKSGAIAVLDDAYSKYESSNYTEARYLELTNIYNNGKDQVNAAMTILEVNRARDYALSEMELLPTLSEERVTEHPFTENYNNYDLVYNDATKSLEVSYDTYKGDWAYIGTTSTYDLKHDITTQNTFTITVTNLGSEKMTMAITLATDFSGTQDAVNAETGIFEIEPNQTVIKNITVSKKIQKIFAFIDSCYVEGMYDRHNHAGKVILSNFGFTYMSENSSSRFKTENDCYTIADKEGVLANITYNNMAGNTWTRVSYDLLDDEQAANRTIRMTFKNNGSESIRIVMHAGNWVLDASSSTYVFNPLYSNYTYESNGQIVADNGNRQEIPAGEMFEFIITADEGLKNQIITQVYFELDSAYYEPELSSIPRTGDVDVVSIILE